MHRIERIKYQIEEGNEDIVLLSAFFLSYNIYDAQFMSNTRLVPPRNFELTIMPRLGIVHPKLPRNLTCPGCKIILDGNTALTHIPGCVRCSGLNATVKHNALVKYIGDLCIRAGIPCEIEPRAFTTWTCQACNANVNYENQVIHQRTNYRIAIAEPHTG